MAMMLAVIVVSSGCSAADPKAPPAQDPYSAAAVAWGNAPQENAGTTFQPDVVIVGGGGSSVRSVTADGFTWTLDPEAPNADSLEVGSVMFVTGRGVGRVIDLADTDDGLAVTVAPVEITEIIQDGTYSSLEPVPLDQPVMHDMSGAFWADPEILNEVGSEPLLDESTVPEASGSTGVDEGIGLASVTRPAPGAVPDLSVPTLPRPPAAAGKVAQAVTTQTGAFALSHTCCKAGTGMDFSYDKDGLVLSGKVDLKMQAPSAQFNLDISGGTLRLAEFKINGASTLHTELKANSTPQPGINKASTPLGMDVDFSIPIANILGIPFSLTVTQTLTVDIFMPGTAEVNSVGDYKLGAQLGMRYANGRFTSLSGGSFDANAAVRGSSSIAVGLSGITVQYSVNFRLGIGFAGFSAGLDFTIVVLVSASVGAPIGFNPRQDAESPIEQCKNARGVLKVEWGIGYTIPKYLADITNFFLKFFKSKPIERSKNYHGFKVVDHKDVTYPQSGFCK